MKIGDLEIKGYCALAPMAGVADRAMREICVEYGAAFTVGELTSAKGVALGDKKSLLLLGSEKNGAPFASQIFGCDPATMARAAAAAEELGPDFIDINMGCPAPKVAASGGGSALMKNERLAGEVVAAVVDAVRVPVTVKMRTGIDDDHINAPSLAKICEQAGAKAITVHGRTRAQMYAPPVNREVIKQVKNAVSIPVIANGDITDALSAKEMMDDTGCDFLMVGRAARGNPFIFAEINAFFEGENFTKPSLQERLSVCKRQIALMMEHKGEHIAFLEARKHLAWYLNGINSAATLRRMCGYVASMADVEAICEKALELNG